MASSGRIPWMRWVLIGLGGTVALVLLLASAGALWLVHGVKHKVTPPPEGASILNGYAVEQPPVRRPAAAVVPPFDWSTIDTPPMAMRPWVRWWWPGAAVDPVELKRELEELKETNFGGAEVQPFLIGISDPAVLARGHQFDTPAYYQRVQGMLGDAGELGLQIDLTDGSGWPPGGSEIRLSESVKTLALATATFSGGREIRLSLPRPTPLLGDWLAGALGFGLLAQGHEQLMGTLVGRPVSGSLPGTVFGSGTTVQLDDAQNVSARVHDGTLDWNAPPGRWMLVAAYAMPDGEMPSFSACASQGYVVDVLNAATVSANYNYLFGTRTGLNAFYGGVLRGVFNDSWELKPKRLTTPDILAEFRQRRGYDLAPFLPVVVGAGRENYLDPLHVPAVPRFAITPLDERIRYDYQLTVSDLFIERFMRNSRQWAEARGLLSRGQAYGVDFDVLRALGENSIPEVESLYGGGGEDFLKFGASSAALYGRNLVGAESFDWAGRDYTGFAGKLKAAADKLFLNGVNAIVYHGFPYYLIDEKVYGPQGWYPFSVSLGPGFNLHFSDNYSPRNPIWSDLPALNAYIGRVQNLLRQGHPRFDVLIYYPFLGYPSPGVERRGGDEPLFGGAFPDSNPAPSTQSSMLGPLFSSLLPKPAPDPRIEWLGKLQPVIDELDRRGITWTWVNGDAIRSGRLSADGRFASSGSFDALLLPNVDSIPLDDLLAIDDLGVQGLPLFVFGTKPVQQPGFLDASNRDLKIRQLAAHLHSEASAQTPADLVQAISRIVRDTQFAGASAGIRRFSRSLSPGARIEFFANQSEQADRVTIKLPDGQPAWWFEPLDGTAQPAAVTGDTTALSLAPFESRILVQGVAMPPGLSRDTLSGLPVLWRREIDRWAVKVGSNVRSSTALFDWRTDPAFRYAAGTATYEATFTIGSGDTAKHYLLSVGLVPGSAVVRINGADVGRASLPPGRLDITPFIRSGANTITIIYTPPQRNAFIGKALAGDARYRLFAGEAPGPLVPSGLLTPVTIAALGAELRAPRDQLH